MEDYFRSETDLYNGLSTKYKRLVISNQTPQLKGIITILRDVNTNKEDFMFYTDRVSRIVLEDALNLLPYNVKTIKSPMNVEYNGIAFNTPICGVSVLRSGEALENALRAVCRGCRIGKVLVEKGTSSNSEVISSYVRLPTDVSNRVVILMYPVMETGKSICRVIQILTEHHVETKNIICMVLFASKQGIETIFSRYPDIRLVVASVDPLMDKENQLLPGLGNFGDRYFGT
ncbi:hypothetical protein ACR3K2_16810 [Cryptosporidium serpentis]